MSLTYGRGVVGYKIGETRKPRNHLTHMIAISPAVNLLAVVLFNKKQELKMITFTRKNGGFWGTTIVINDEYSVKLSGHESKQVELPENTNELNIDVSMSDTSGTFKIKNANKVQEIIFTLKMWGFLLVGTSPNIVCKVIFKDGTEIEPLNKKTGAAVNANANRINF